MIKISKYLGTLAMMSAGLLFTTPTFAKVVVNVDNVKLDGSTTASATADNSVNFNATNNTVTLNNNHSSFINIDCRKNDDYNVKINCTEEESINLVLKGENKINGAIAGGNLPNSGRLYLGLETKVSGDGSLIINDDFASEAIKSASNIIMDSGKIDITGKQEGIVTSGELIINNGSLIVNTVKNAINIGGPKLVFGVGTINIKSTLESGILATNTNITISGGENTIIGSDYGIKLTADTQKITIDNGTTKIQGNNERAVLINYNGTTEETGLALGTGVYIVEDEVAIKSDGNSRYFAKGDTAVKTVTFKKLIAEEEKNSGTGDNAILYIAVLAISAAAIIFKSRHTSRF